jgi:hypothetical protein
MRNIALTSGLVLDLAQHQRRRMMFTMTKIAVAAALVAATSTVVLAEFDPNLANRYPAYAGSISGNELISSPARLHESRGAAVGRESSFEVDRTDRASSPYAGGGF